MASSITYKRLFELECWHGYYLNTADQEFGALDAVSRAELIKQKGADLQQDFAITPSPDTLKRLSGEGLLFKTLPTGFFVAIRAEKTDDGNFAPVSMPAEGLTLTFYLRIRNPLFYNYTNLPMDNAGRGLYYLSNRAENSNVLPEDPTLYVAQEIPAYENRVYKSGDLVMANGQRYEALMDQENPVAPPADLAWKRLAAAGYLNGGDAVQRMGPLSSYSFQSNPAKRATFTLHNLDQQEFTVRLTQEAGNTYPTQTTDSRGNSFPVTEVLAPENEPFTQVKLDLRTVPAGRYTLTVAGEFASGDSFTEEVPVYLMHDPQKVWAVVEVFHKAGDVLGAYKMIDEEAGNRLMAPRYILHVQNRSTYWRYHFGKPPEKKPKNSELVQSGDSFVTLKPQPLTTSYTEVTYNSSPLPNPSVKMIKPEQSKIYSDVYL